LCGSIEKHRVLLVAVTELVEKQVLQKRKYVFMSLEQNAGPNQNIKAGNKSLDRVEV